MKRSNLRKISFLLSVILTAPSMAACGEGKIADETSVNDTGTTSGNVTGEQDEFADMDLGGQEIRIYTSTNADVDSRTSNYLIEGPDEEQVMLFRIRRISVTAASRRHLTSSLFTLTTT